MAASSCLETPLLRLSWMNRFRSLTSRSFICSRISNVLICLLRDSTSERMVVYACSLYCFRLLRLALEVREFMFIYCSIWRILCLSSYFYASAV